MKYSKDFERDIAWYWKVRRVFNFDGKAEYFKSDVLVYRKDNKTKELVLFDTLSLPVFQARFPHLCPTPTSILGFSQGMLHSYLFDLKTTGLIIGDKNGVDAKEAFFSIDSRGVVLPTRHPNILHTLLKTKGSVNLHIKMYAEDRASGILPKMVFKEMLEEIQPPDWFEKAVETQKTNYY